MQALEGIRVVELAVAVQGPAAGGFLAEMGADVIKVERPSGDGNRWHRGVGNTLPKEVIGTQFIGVSSGKRSVALDIHTPLGRDVVYRLIDGADIFVSNFREEALERMGVSYEALRERNERLIYAIANGFGHRGPARTDRMSDQFAQARSGIAGVTGAPGDGPLTPGAIIGDTGGAMALLLGILVALAARERHGIGQKVSTSAYGALIWMQAWEINHSSVTGHLLTSDGPFHPNSPGIAGIYETADGGAFCLGIRDDEAWRAFCEFGGIDEVLADPRWDTPEKRRPMSDPRHVASRELRPHVARAMASHAADAWVEFFAAQGEAFTVQRVLDYGEVLDDPQALENGYIVEKEIPFAGRHRVVGNPVQLSATPAAPSPLFSDLGEHTAEVMRDLGFSADEIAVVEAQKAPPER